MTIFCCSPSCSFHSIISRFSPTSSFCSFHSIISGFSPSLFLFPHRLFVFHIDFHERSLRRRHTADRLEEGVRTLPPRFGTVITESESGSVALGCGTGKSRRDRRCVLPFSPVLVSGIRSCRNSTSTFGSIFSEIFENSAASPRLAASPRATSPLQFFLFSGSPVLPPHPQLSHVSSYSLDRR